MANRRPLTATLSLARVLERILDECWTERLDRSQQFFENLRNIRRLRGSGRVWHPKQHKGKPFRMKTYKLKLT